MKPFPADVNWVEVWRNRWIILNFVNQIAHGTETNAIAVSDRYGGSIDFGKKLFEAAKKIII